MKASASTLAINGIDGSTGAYLLPHLNRRRLATAIQGSEDPEHTRELQRLVVTWKRKHLGLIEPLSSTDLAQAGWGVVFAEGIDDAVKEALAPLLEQRRAQASALVEERFREMTYKPGESKRAFLTRYGVGYGPVDPANVPYYLLLVGDPEAIPYSVQHQLEVQYAVGRLDLGTPEAFSSYAETVLATEQGTVQTPPRAAFFGVRNPDDRTTELSSEFLVEPLAQLFQDLRPGWQVDRVLGEEATRERLASLLAGADKPAFLFSASHGMGFPLGDPRQLPHQGAPLCQNWPGPEHWQGAIPEDHYFAGEHLSSDACPAGLVVFHFGCYGAGTPRFDAFAQQLRQRQEIAPRDFTTELPRRLLSHPRGSALAVVGHVERSWAFSFLWPEVGEQLQVFESTLRRFLGGHPLGSALDPFGLRYAELAADLSQQLDDIGWGKRIDEEVLTHLWTATADARNFVLLGDPAVRLRSTHQAPPP